MRRWLFAVFAGFFFLASSTLAQNGKIAGRVTDKEAKQPLIAANVVIVGTTLGGSTDVEGNYVILNVPPGDYDLKASYIGYRDLTIREVSVVSGLTQEVNFELPSTAIEMQPVLIVFEHSLIEKSATNAIRIVKGDEFLQLPFRDVAELLALQPGVVLQNGLIHIRGSRPDEVGYTVGGATATNIVSRSGGSLVTTIPEALEEVLVQAGGYTAEFGGANAGLVQQNLKTATNRYHASYQWESDNFASPGQKFLGTYSYGYTDQVVTFSGPTVSDQAKLFIAGENFFTRDYAPTFWSGSPERWSDGSPIDKVYDTGLRGDGTQKGDAQILSWLPGNISARFQNRYSLNGTLLLDFQPVYVKFGGALSWQRQRINSDPIGNLFDQDRLPLRDQSEGFLNAKMTYFVDPKTFIEANLNYLDQRFKTYDPVFKDDILAYNDSLSAAEHGWTYPAYVQQPYPYDFYGFPFSRPGARLTNFSKNQTGYIGFSVSAVSQIETHELKLGASFERWTARNYGFLGTGQLNLNRSLLDYLRQRPDSLRDEQTLIATVRRMTTPDMYGFDELGRPIDDGPDGPRHPKFFSAYVQDKIEISDLIIQAGLRFDQIDMDSWSLENPQEPITKEATSTVLGLRRNKAFQYVSPRLGFSFPVSDKTVFHIQYGKFVQAPALDVAFRGIPRTSWVLNVGQLGNVADPIAFDLEPTRTTQYEIGFTQQFTDFAAFDFTAFYKDIQGQLQYGFVQTDAGWSPPRYPTYINGDFSTTKGAEFRLTLRRTQRLQAVINFTFSDARGTNSFPTSARGATVSADGKTPTVVLPLTYDQAQRGSVNIDYRFGSGEGGPILERLGLNLLFTFNSGHPYTRSKLIGNTASPDIGALSIAEVGISQPLEPLNASTTPWNFNLDLRVDKTITLSDLDLNLYVYVQNVLNTRSVSNVYFLTGNAFDDGFFSNPDSKPIVDYYGQRYVDLYRVINLENRRHNMIANGFDLFGIPRQIRFGLRLAI